MTAVVNQPDAANRVVYANEREVYVRDSGNVDEMNLRCCGEGEHERSAKSHRNSVDSRPLRRILRDGAIARNKPRAQPAAARRSKCFSEMIASDAIVVRPRKQRRFHFIDWKPLASTICMHRLVSSKMWT
ncbi:MAG TPA: hypothetical protein VKY22_15260 [Bradyrhizobium sp.]|nr:hypothetical protein [Bradyrhizobium sp.]